MSKNSTPAYVYQVGDRLPPITPGGEQPILTKVNRLREEMVIEFITDEGAWRFQWHEPVSFPRRADGSHRNWFSLGIVPLADDLMVGDVLPPVAPAPADATQRYVWKSNTQTVSRIDAEPGDTGRWLLRTVDDVSHQIRTYIVDRYEPLEFPRIPRTRPPVQRRVLKKEFGGPYRQRSTGRPFFFLIHQFGRGRWQPDAAPFNPYEPLGQPPFVMRPPNTAVEWRDFAFEGLEEDRHPNEPTTTVPATIDRPSPGELC